MTVTRYAAVVAASFAAAVVYSPLAHGDNHVPSGSYAVAYPTLGMERTWIMTPCGDGCTVAASERSDSFVQAWEFRLDNGRWVFRGPGTFACGTGATSPADFEYGFDAVSLAGEGAATMRSDACGDAVGTTYRFPFQLTANS